MSPPSIALVGMACEFPDARTPAELFEGTLAGRRAFRRIPDCRLPLSDYASEDASDVDLATVGQAALLEGWEFDRERFRVVGSTYRSADPTHWLALDVAARALADAGFEDPAELPRERSGVLLGNTLTGEFARAQALRLRWPYVRQVLREVLGESPELERIEARYKAPFEPFGDESLAGGLANTIAGRICNHFDLKGGGYTVDGACASSLLSVAQACQALVAGDLDLALAGGVDLSLDPFELVGFSRAGALARGEMRVYDERACGFWPGEGCGIVVLMREDEARARGLAVRARIAGWGIASDGAGGISRPEKAGQLRAVHRAYERAGVDPGSLGYVEGHGTGTPVGDATELSTLSALWQSAGRGPNDPLAVGSIKSRIGHTKAAAGAAGLIQATLALAAQVLPPTAGCEKPAAAADPQRGGPLRVPTRAEPWPRGRGLRAGVSSMGFGGIDCHVLLESPEEERRGQPLPVHARLDRSAQDAELLLLAADTDEALLGRVEALAEQAESLSRAELADLAGALEAALEGHACRVRAAVVASRADEWAAGLRTLAEWLRRPDPASPRLRRDPAGRVVLGRGEEPARVGLLFPGQGAPVPRDPGAVARRFAGVDEGPAAREARDWLDRSAGADPGLPLDTALAQPAITAVALVGLATLEALGVRASLAVGHSVGELAALHWAGALSAEEAVDVARRRGALLSRGARSGGAMASVGAPLDRVEALVKGEACVVAAHNGPRRFVVSGDRAGVESVLERARREGIPASPLRVSHAFHSPHVARCADPLRAELAGVAFAPVARRVLSTRTGLPLEPGVDLAEHLARQLCEPVRFAEAVSAAEGQVDLWVELGPGRMLASLAPECGTAPAVSLDAGSPSLRGCLECVALLFAARAPFDRSALFADRALRPFEPGRPLRFLESPCGDAARRPGGRVEPAADLDPASPPAGDADALEVLMEHVAAHCELPRSALDPGDRLLSDLHCTSIAVGTLASTVARALGRPPLVAPGEFADATLAELATAIEAEERVPVFESGVPGVDAWVRPFEVVRRERPRPRAARTARMGSGEAGWRVFALSDDLWAEALRRRLAEEVGGDGVLVHLPREAEDDALPLLLAGAHSALDLLEGAAFVLVHHSDAGVAVARTLHQEASTLVTRVIELAEADRDAAGWVLEEVLAAGAYVESTYTRDGRRWERRLEPLAGGWREGPLPLGAEDVLLVTGGGKGIAAECGRSLARRTGCALALVGRSDPERDEALAAHLEGLAADGLRHAYARADVGDPAALGAAVGELETRLGPVTGLLHGAGVNEPAPLARLERRDFDEVLAPKCGGLETLLARLDPARLRCVLGFGSILSEIGLPGEAHYALANERLSRRIEAFGREHPQVRCLALDWSVWSGVGMAERLGRVETLAARNITAITPEAGESWLLRLLARPETPTRVFLSGRFGGPPTLAVAEAPLPVLRFLERVREHTPGVELVVEASLSADEDPYLGDHVFDGEAILPGVLALEAFAQVAVALLGSGAGGSRPPCLEEIRFLAPIDVPAGGSRRVRVAGLVRNDGRIDLALRSDATDFQVDHVRGIACAGAGDEDPEETLASEASAGELPVPLRPERDLYGSLLFQGGRFQRLAGYHALHRASCEARVEARAEEVFGAFQPRTLVLGDPGARDAAIHAIQACVPDRPLLPIGFDAVEPGAGIGEGPLRVRAREREHGGGRYVYDVDLVDDAGGLRERWRGLRLQEIAGRAAPTRWAAPLLGPRLEALAPSGALRAALAEGEDRETSNRALALAADRPLAVGRRSDGKPCIEEGPGAPAASTSHGVGWTLAVLGDGPLACDLEGVQPREAATWSDLLGPLRMRLARFVARTREEPEELAATRIWGAVECLRKAGLDRDTPLVVESGAADEVLRLRAGEATVTSLAARLRRPEATAVATLLQGARRGLL